MKKILSVILAAIMLMSTLIISTGAKGTLIHSDYFDEGFLPRNWILKNSAFEWDKKDEYIFGYGDAIVIESFFGNKFNRWWDKFYASIDFQVVDSDNLWDFLESKPQTVSLWYTDLMENGENGGARGANYMFIVEVNTGKVRLHKDYTFSYKDEFGITQQGSIIADICEAQLSEPLEIGADAPWYNIGMRVTDGKIECYFNEELVLSSSVEDGKEKVGTSDVFADAVDATVGSQKSAIVVFNGGGHGATYLGQAGFIRLDNFEVWTPDYDFVDVTYGDANGDGRINLADVTTMLKVIAKWELTDYDEAAADVNVDGTVNLADVTKLLRFIAEWVDVRLGEA